jgi:ion channel-forming bestrophin family protein
MSLWLHLFLLPFQIYSSFHYLTIPATAFSSFLIGSLEIGQEIENPFNYNLNDLDLDHFCLAIQRELQEVTTHTSPDPDTFVFSAWNQPFAPAEELTTPGHTHYAPKGAGDRIVSPTYPWCSLTGAI